MEVILFFALFVAAVFVSEVRKRERRHRRRQSLRKESDGTWVWIDLDGTERRSLDNPDAPGGEWDGDGGDGDGGDGGGD